MTSQLETENILVNLDAEQAKAFSDYESLFASKGWKRIEAWLAQEVTKSVEAAAHAPSWDKNRELVGEERRLRQLLHLPEAVMNEFTGTAEANAEVAPEYSDDTEHQS